MVVRPPDFSATKKYPMLVLLHGGPQTMWDNAWGYRRQVTRDAANGGGIPKEFTKVDETPGPEGQPKAARPAEPFHDLQLEKAIEVLAQRLKEGKG